MAAHGRQTVAAILVAAGSGQRLAADVPKAFVKVAGRTLLEHAAARFGAHPLVDTVVVVAPADQLEAARALTGAPTVVGGATRQESVARGLAALTSADPEAGSVGLVVVHDVARPFVPDSVITAVVEALHAGAEAVVPVVPIHDTVRRTNGDGSLAGLVDRASLAAVQTPQGFRLSALVSAHAAARGDATDDAALIEAQGGQVTPVAGSEASFKITTPLDLARAEAMAALLSAATPTGG
jgi:2-C-methyl-D-erythritol 4-phosphate cytidylyltransferase